MWASRQDLDHQHATLMTGWAPPERRADEFLITLTIILAPSKAGGSGAGMANNSRHRASFSSRTSLKLGDVVYYVGHGTIVPRDDGRGLPKWQEALYIAMERNSVHVSDFFRLPNDSVVLIGRQVAI